jgi:hypothetical protein
LRKTQTFSVLNTKCNSRKFKNLIMLNCQKKKTREKVFPSERW